MVSIKYPEMISLGGPSIPITTFHSGRERKKGILRPGTNAIYEAPIPIKMVDS